MKKSELKSFIKEEIISLLTEASEEELKNAQEFNKELEKTIDLKKLIDWATNKKLSDDEIENLVALCGNTFVPKLRGLDAVAEKKGMDKQLARDTFIEKIWDEEPKLQVIKTSNDTAPVWAKDLKEMERRK